MTELDWSRVHCGDEITAKGRVREIHERDDGLTTFVVENAELLAHTPRKRGDLITCTPYMIKVWTDA